MKSEEKRYENGKGENKAIMVYESKPFGPIKGAIQKRPFFYTRPQRS